MKYGLLKFGSYETNVGDYMQLAGIMRAYKRLGITEEEIIEIERNQLSLYDGEYVILPMTAAFIAVHGTQPFPLSEKIIPIFIGFFTADESIAIEIAKYEKFGPFGCRDLVTMQIIRNQGVQAYMSGCLSICFEKRTETPKNGKVYLGEPPEKLREYIPREYMENAVELPKAYRAMKDCGYSDDNANMAKQYARDLVTELKNNAKLVITRRLHLALPCVGMGIPVILAHECDSGLVEECRFAGLDKIIRVYKPTEYDAIDWNPEAPDIEWVKEKAIQLAMDRIVEAKNHWGGVCELSDYYESTEKQIFYSGMRASYLSENQKQYFISNAWKMERTAFEYIVQKKFEDMHLVFYGAGDKGKWAIRRYYDYIRRIADFSLVDGDSNKQGKRISEVLADSEWDLNTVGNFVIENPQIIKNINRKNLVVVVTCDRYYSGPGALIGNILIREYGLREGKELFFLDKLNYSMDMHMSSTSAPFYFLHGF